MPPDRGLMDKPSSGMKGNKKRLTYAFTTNADGSEKLRPFVIGKSACPRAFNKKRGDELGFYYRNNAKAWMTAMLYQEWLLDWDSKLRGQGRFVLLLQDNFSGHIKPNGLTNIQVENFTPNLTSHIQPNDAGIIRCFKAHYCSKFISRAINRYDHDVPPALIYDIDQLKAMRLADVAWQEVQPMTIYNCWCKTGILPLALVNNESSALSTPSTLLPSVSVALLHGPPDDNVIQAEQSISDSLNQLEQRGVLQMPNRLSIKEILDPELEHRDVPDMVDLIQDIFQSVNNQQEVEEMMDVDGSSGSGGSNSGDVVRVKPTHKKALAAVSTVMSFISDTNDPSAWALESLLTSLGHQTQQDMTRSMKPTQITDYFRRK